jgi:CHAD domain-containing protein
VLHRLETGDVRGVHQARVASRRLRELLPVLELDAEVVRKIGRRLRKVTRGLGPIRECDVLLGVAQAWTDAGPRERRGLTRVAADVQEDRRRALADDVPVDAARNLERAARKLKRAARALEVRDESNPRRRAWLWALEARVARRAAALEAAVQDAGNVYLPERLHGVRLAAKKLRYAVELLAEARGHGGRDVRTLTRAQDLLGHLHDLQVLVDRARAVQSRLRASERTARRDLDALISMVEARCRGVHARYLRLRGDMVELAERLGAASPARAARRRAG